MHHSHQRFGKGAEIDLKIWEDSYGLAFSFRPPAHAYSLVCGIAQSRYRECSVGAELLDSMAGDYFDVRSAALYEISIAPRGACPGTMCWHSGVPLHEMRPDVRPLALAWEQGRGGR